MREGKYNIGAKEWMSVVKTLMRPMLGEGVGKQLEDDCFAGDHNGIIFNDYEKDKNKEIESGKSLMSMVHRRSLQITY